MNTAILFSGTSPMEQYPMSGPKAITASPYAIRKAVAEPDPVLPENELGDLDLILHIPKGLESVITGLGQAIDIKM